MGKASKKSGTSDDQKFQLFDELPSGGKLGRTAADSGRRFITGDRVPLSWDHPVGAVFARVLSDGRLHRSTPARRQDWAEFEGAYAATGRPPFSPRQMTGLIL